MKIGIVGGGQLAQMLARAGAPLGCTFRFLDPSPKACAASLGEHIVAAFDDAEALKKFGERLDVITYEFESVPASSIELLSTLAPVFPSANALAVSQERFAEKTLFTTLGIPTPTFLRIDSPDDLLNVEKMVGLPCVLKTRRQGYDGKGQKVIKKAEDLASAWQDLGSVPLIAEEWIPFDREVSVIAARGQDGSFVRYPLSENIHREGILRRSIAPASSALSDEAEAHIRKVMNHLQYVGVLCIEFFEHQGKLIANEMAPRVHNSGHWTIEGAETSQFENHIRAIKGMPLGSTKTPQTTVLLNLIGSLPSDLSELEGKKDVFVHLYGKSPAPGRKIGHVTFVGADAVKNSEKYFLKWNDM